MCGVIAACSIQNYRRRLEVGKRNNTYERDLKYKKKLERLYKYTKKSYFSPCYPVNKNGYYDSDNPVYFKRFYLSRCITSYYKRQANKAVRRYKGDISNGCNYKKIFEYVWSVY